MTDRGASFAAATGGALTLFITTPPNGSSIWVCLVDEVPGGGGEHAIIAGVRTSGQFLSPRRLVNSEAAAATVA